MCFQAVDRVDFADEVDPVDTMMIAWWSRARHPQRPHPPRSSRIAGIARVGFYQYRINAEQDPLFQEYES
jgi:hypothetical protein